jgi:pimeloyl-ACP methyl ester carboxylesterase
MAAPMHPDPEIPPPVRIPFPLKRLLVRLSIWLALGAGILYGVVVWWCAGEIAEPPRRVASAEQQTFLDGTAKAGFAVDEFSSSDGMPALVCTPVPAARLSKKAGIIRGQMFVRGISLKPAGEIVGTLLILHGRKGIKEDCLAVAERFCAVGFRCVIPDLPGHGKNPKRFTTYGVHEAPIILRCYEEAAVKFGFAGQQCAIFGQSMGGAEAIQTVSLEASPFASMVVVSTFDKLDTVIRGQTNGLLGSVLGAAVRAPAKSVYAWKTGVEVSEINSAGKAQQLRIPTFVIHGNADTMVPTASGKALYDSIPSGTEKRWLEVPGAAHSNVLVTDFPLYATIAEWFLDHLTGG